MSGQWHLIWSFLAWSLIVAACACGRTGAAWATAKFIIHVLPEAAACHLELGGALAPALLIIWLGGYRKLREVTFF